MLYIFMLAGLSFFCRSAAAVGAGIVKTDANGYADPWVQEPDGRGSWTIIYSSLFTIVLCAWSALHLNIPPPKETKDYMAVRMVAWVVGSTLLPELIVVVALSQWWKMREFRNTLNEVAMKRHKARSEETKIEHAKFVPYSSIYAWFAIMGGFAVDISSIHGDLDQATLSVAGLVFLADHGHFCKISDEEISDKSKADYLAKSLVCFQVFWFVCQVVQRFVAGLPISLLEFRTLVNISGALITYLVWFGKPLNIHTPKFESTDGIEELLAVLLFQRCIEGRPHQRLVSRGCKRPPFIPHESHLWCWTNDNRMVIVDKLPANLAKLVIPDEGARIEPCRTKLPKWYNWGGERLVPLAANKVLRNLSQGADISTTPAQTPSPRIVSQNATRELNIGIAVTAKDEKRLELVRKYIIASGRDHNTFPGANSDTRFKRCWAQGWAFYIEHEEPKATDLAKKSMVQSSVSTTGDLESQRLSTQVKFELPSSEAVIKSKGPTPCHGHGDSTHTPVDELSCFPHSHNAGLLIFSNNGATALSIASETHYYETESGEDNEIQATPLIRDTIIFLLFVFFCVVGGVHLIPIFTKFNFPTDTEKLIWNVSCYTTMAPLGMVIAFLPIYLVILLVAPLIWYLRYESLSEYTISHRGVSKAFHLDPNTRFAKCCRQASELSSLLVLVLLAVWVSARAFLFVEPFVALRKEKGEIFLTPDWNWLDYVPHI